MGITFGDRWGMARATPLPPSPFLVEASIDLTVGVETAPQEWMLEDLNLLDEGHIGCLGCYPEAVEPLVVYTAMCGTRAVTRSGQLNKAPAGTCETCAALFDSPCRKCGTL